MSSVLTPEKSSAAPQPVDLHALARAHRRIGERDHREREQAKRHVDEEHPAPGERVGDVAADERSGNRRQAPHAAEHRLRLGSLLERVELADDRHAERDDGAGAEALDARASDRAASSTLAMPHITEPEQEHHDAGQVHAAPAVEIGKAAPDRDRRRGRQQVGRKTPSCSAPGRRAWP